jgi:putative ABC transport system permease protein
MSILSALRVAINALMVNKGRSALTSLGIVIGISAVISLVSAGDGARMMLDERLENIGKNLILIRPGARNNVGVIATYTPLTKEDAAALRRRMESQVEGIAELQYAQKLVSNGRTHWLTTVVGMQPIVKKIRKWDIEPGGRFISDEDMKRQELVCLIGQTVKQKLFPDRNPLGQMLRVERTQLRIIGVLGHKGRSLNGADQDDQIFVPLPTLQHKILPHVTDLGMIMMEVRDESQTDKIKTEIEQVLARQHHQKPGEANSFDVVGIQEVAELANFITKTLQVLVVVIAAVSLLVGGIGVMNIMLVSVTERTREIGIRMAVGATPVAVLGQFLIEAVVLALVGGLIGIALGVGAAWGMARLLGWPLTVSPFYVLLACGVSAAVGVLFGYYPAWKASRLDPIVALRYE